MPNPQWLRRKWGIESLELLFNLADVRLDLHASPHVPDEWKHEYLEKTWDLYLLPEALQRIRKTTINFPANEPRDKHLLQVQ